MTKKREVIAQRARLRRKVQAKLDKERKRARRAHVSEVLYQISLLLRDKEFVMILAESGVASAPACLIDREILPSEQLSDREVEKSIIVFVAAWKFMFPLFLNARTSDFLERSHPGFIADLKDTFISLVMDGPFVNERRPAARPAY